MTYEEVIKHINVVKSRIRGGDEAYDLQRKEALNMAIEALEKQIAKKPIIDEWKRVQCVNEHNLPVLCRNRKMPFCPFCGQKIDWSDDE